MVTVTAVHGDITRQRVDAIVNAANNAMRGGGGVDGAIHRAGGRVILDDCIARFPNGLRTGDAGWTTAGDLPATWVIHTVGPDYGAGERDRALLESCYRRALEVADEIGARSVSFPLISAGVYAWPLNDAIDAAITTIAKTPTRVEEVVLVSFSEDTHRRVQSQVHRLFPPPTEPGSVGQLFDRAPAQMGMRGDAYLWLALRAEFAATPLPSTWFELRPMVVQAAEGIIGAPLAHTDDPIHVPEFDPGHGMSAGNVLPSWWHQTGIPILIDRFEAAEQPNNTERSAD
ncbi:O-acetyl-ADP-ribose deacetylase (regulator of RNase III) [Microbacterium trichothecenolyticum]|uniref:O-acetyl-ADP-ribose deacetylase n=1 Tax=Microbacterium trichothecenolyticum TaxID=69370 RepID=UPI00286096D0|nr:O-acetyl-ADP-ribose deacetylase [Microbacterium trichothecenolyticum]MDR7185041.1 O-acetyl-ADP-ribose deacetylase (regulator of RNase III) [Microbacterium trichothecenolyticum]